MNRYICFTILMVLPCSANTQPLSHILDTDTAISASIKIELSYLRCITPDTCTCVALNEEESKNCPECLKWEKTYLNRLSSVEARRDSFAYSETGNPRNRQFLDFASRTVYGITLPRRPDGSPISASQLYQNPHLYGWIELGPDDSKEGALAVWPTMGGLVLKDTTAHPGEEQLEKIQVLYPSHKLDGELNVAGAAYLSSKEPKFIVPEALVVNDVVTVDDEFHAAPASPPF